MATVTVGFPWKDAYAVGIPQIDAQHKTLVKLINDLYQAMQAGKGKDIMGAILDELVLYTQRHFSDEEALLSLKHYSKLASHRAVHQDLTRQVLEMQSNFRASKLVLSLDVMQFLKDWLSGHILTHDKAYAKELLSHN